MNRLYPRDRFVLEQLCQSDGVVSRWDLVDSLKPGAMETDDGLVRYYVARLRHLFGAEAVLNIKRTGYLATSKARQALAGAVA